MNEKTFSKLEFGKILEQLAAHTGFALSREQAEQLLPVRDSYEAIRLQAETDEARSLLREHPLFSLGGLWDIRTALHHAEIGGVLPAEDLVNIAAVCRSARNAKTFFSELKGNYPLLTGLGRSLVFVRTVETAVEKAIGPDMSINDAASERLYSIRRKKAQRSEQIRFRLDSLIKNPATAKFLQEPIVTIREDRFVVPVKQEYRGQVAGVAHDMSSSGATLFVEPLAVMELNNDLAALRREEEDEINAILRALSLAVNNFAVEIGANLNILAKLDFILAKGQLSYDLDGAAPKINDTGVVRLVRARHPLIPSDRVVPINLELKQDTAALVITGPNTGGKTVTLKTIGLLCCMGMAGLHIPAEEGSEISAFRAVFADIGDEQSIEQSLSTFSSHMTNIVDILGQADRRSLILFDELGAGTDPTEGAALAMSILKYTRELGVKVVATTHYSELKAFAYNTPGFINASMEFDVATLSPTYKLVMGLPGKSNAFEISRRLGLPDTIIEEAAASLSSEDAAVAAMLANLEDLRRRLADEQEQVAELRARSERREQLLHEREQQLQVRESNIIRKAHEQAQQIIDETMAKSRALFDEEQKKIAEQQSAQRVWQESQKKLKSWRTQLEEEVPEPVFEGKAPSTVKLGDYVFLPKLNQYGNIAALPDSSGDVMVQVGMIKLKSKLIDLRLADEEKAVKKNKKGRGISGSDLAMKKSATVESSLNLQGLDTMEALPVLDKYIDDAFIAGLRVVQINHGRGTGALRNFVQDYLKKHRLVKRFHSGSYEEGGQGVTIVEINV